MRREVEVCRDPSFQRQRVHRCEQADDRRCGPERTWLGLEHEASGGRTDQPAELPGEARERHVAAEQSRFGQIHDEGSVDRTVQALPESEHGDRHAEDDGRLGSGEPSPADQHRDERSRPDHAHQREPTHASPALDELHDRQLAERDDAGEHEPEHPDRRLAHVRGVLRERRQQLAHDRDPGADEDDIEKDVAQKDTVAENVGVAAGLVMRFDMTWRRD